MEQLWWCCRLGSVDFCGNSWESEVDSQRQHRCSCGEIEDRYSNALSSFGELAWISNTIEWECTWNFNTPMHKPMMSEMCNYCKSEWIIHVVSHGIAYIPWLFINAPFWPEIRCRRPSNWIWWLMIDKHTISNMRLSGKNILFCNPSWRYYVWSSNPIRQTYSRMSNNLTQCSYSIIKIQYVKELIKW